MLKAYLNDNFRHLITMDKGEEDIEALRNAIEQAWNALDTSSIDACIRSMRRRSAAVIEAKGWYTKW